jgi:hypothetical protein
MSATRTPRPVRTFMAEQMTVLDILKELDSVMKRLKGINSFDVIEEDLHKLENISHHLLEAERNLIELGTLALLRKIKK